jgi:putative membrane protein
LPHNNPAAGDSVKNTLPLSGAFPKRYVQMILFSEIAVVLVAMLHGCFLVLEMFLWDKPAGLKAFGQAKEQASLTKVLAANQGLYNGFIGAGLLLGVFQGAAGFDFKVFFLLCVIVAGVFGAFTASRKILYVQAFPGIIALVLVLIS